MSNLLSNLLASGARELGSEIGFFKRILYKNLLLRFGLTTYSLVFTILSLFVVLSQQNSFSQVTFSNATDICPPDGNTTGTTSTINVSGMSSSLATVTVTIPNISHTWYDDLDIMLISPTGQRLVLMSDCGGNNAGNGNRNYVFIQGGTALQDGAEPTASGNVTPTDFVVTEAWPDGAPTITAMNQLTGNPNGNWVLRVIDDTGFDTGCLLGGWSITITDDTPCSGTPNAGVATITSTSGCTGTNFTLSATGLSTGGGLTYQWQSAPTASGAWTNIVGATTASFTTATATVGQTFYRLTSTCAGVSSNSSSVSYTASSCGIVPTTGVSYLTTCSTTIYDAGGASGNYANSSAGTLIIRPTSMDQIITVTGTYATESGADFLRFDEGEDSNPNSFIGTQYSGSGTIIPFSTSGPGIPLVVHFTSNGNTVGTGLNLTVSCTCARPTAITLTPTNAPCGGIGSVTVNSVTAPNQQPWIMTTFENASLPTLPWLPTAAPNAWVSGNALIVAGNNDMARLTQANNSESGALVLREFSQNKNEIYGLFDIFIDNGTSADGIGFSYGPNIANTDPVISIGGYESGVGTGLQISFDTFENGAAAGFPFTTGGAQTNRRNVYLIYNGVVVASFSNNNYDAFRGAQNFIEFYISPTGLISVFMNGGITLFNNVQLPAAYVAANKSNWRAAFTARTGGSNDRHRVDNINLYHFYDYEYSINGTTWQDSPTFTGLTSGNYTMYVRLKGITSCSFTQAFTITAPIASTPPTSISGTPTVCNGASTTLTSVGGTLGTDAEDVWYEGACPTECYKQEWLTQPFPSFANMNVNSVSNGILNVTSTSNDPMIDMSGLGSFDPTSCRYVNIRYRVTAGTANNVEIFFYNTANPAAVGGQTGFGNLISDNTWRTVSVDMWADPEYQTGGNITGWRFDWATAAGVTMDIDFISLSNLPIFGTGTSITVSPTVNTTYFTLKQGPCNSTTCVSQLVTISTNPIASITGSTTACNGTAVTLTASGGGTYNWSASLGTNAIVSVNTAGTYTVTVTSNGCTAQSSITVSAVSCSNFGEFASVVYVQTCSTNNLTNSYYNTTGSVVNQISTTAYQSTNFGSYFQNSGQLKLQGGEMKTWKSNPGNVCGVTLYYRVYPSLSAPSGAFSAITLPFYENCGGSSFATGGPCNGSDQKWQRPGNANPLANIDLTTFAPDTYVLEVYYDITGSNVSNSTCESTVAVNNGGANFISNFTIVAPPTATNTGAYCPGQTIQLNASNGGTAYSWSGPNTFTNSTQNPTIATATSAMAGTYTVSVSLANNCTSTAQTLVVVNPTPTVSLNCPALCAGVASNIIATPSPAGVYTYNWTVLPGGVTNPGNNATVNTSTAGTYTVIATNTTTNCPSAATSCTIAVQNQPSINAISPP
jgi:subtilisin-like proprotein convertase family protein